MSDVKALVSVISLSLVTRNIIIVIIIIIFDAVKVSALIRLWFAKNMVATQ